MESSHYLCRTEGALAHLARARHWQCRGDRFESGMLHDTAADRQFGQRFSFIGRPASAIRLHYFCKTRSK